MLTRYTGHRYRSAASADLVRLVEADTLHVADFETAAAIYVALAPHMTDADMAYLGAVDRFYLFTHILGRVDGLHSWLYDRCREVELEPDGHLDLWAREHYKSSLITFAGSIQEIIHNPEITIGVFSHTKAVSTKFVGQVKAEIESNASLVRLYPDVFWIRPSTEAPVWREAEFTVRRSGNPKEATMEAHGLVDGMPTSRHFGLLLYDDVVVPESVTTPEQIKKTTTAWEMSDNLGSGDRRKWMIGTRYHFGDTYGDLMQRDVVTPRVYPATDNGKLDGSPVLMSQIRWDAVKKTQKSTVASQMLQNPLSGKERVFEPSWFTGYDVRPTTLNVYILADPSRGRTATSDRTAMLVIGLDAQGNKYLLDGAAHRMTLSERWDHLKHLHKKWSKAPGVGLVRVGYERFGQQTDDEYFTERMRDENYFFGIEELSWPREGGSSKQHRIERLQPDIEFGSFFLPSLVAVGGQTCRWRFDGDKMHYTPMDGELSAHTKAKRRQQDYLIINPIRRKNENGEVYDVTREMMDEMIFFPFSTHDDVIDAASRIYDIEAVPAMVVEDEDEYQHYPEDA